MVGENMLFKISLKKQKNLEERMQKLGVLEKDIIEKFIRSSGKGGQKVNKTSTCVYLKHVPSGIEIKCQKERVQSLNRFLARRILVDKIESIILGKESAQQQQIEKIRRQKRRRSKKAKEKVLKLKKMQSEKKKLRAPLKNIKKENTD